MSRQDEREQIRQRMSALSERVGASRAVRVESIGAPVVAEASRDVHSGRWTLSRLPAESRTRRDDFAGRGGGGLNIGEEDASPEADPGTIGMPGWLDDPGQLGWRDRLLPERFRGARFEPGRRGARVLALVGIVAVVFAGVVAFRERPVAQAVAPLPVMGESANAAGVSSPTGPATAVESIAPPVELVVSVVGLVHRTGLVRLPEGSRVADALTAAGGSRENADLTGLNLAQRLRDGDQVLVGPPGPVSGPPQLGSTTISSGSDPKASVAKPAGAEQNSAATGVGATGPIDLNSATEAELDALPGVGPVTAAAIIAWRTSNGRFASVDQLAEVDGIGPTRLARLRAAVKV